MSDYDGRCHLKRVIIGNSKLLVAYGITRVYVYPDVNKKGCFACSSIGHRGCDEIAWYPRLATLVAQHGSSTGYLSN